MGRGHLLERTCLTWEASTGALQPQAQSWVSTGSVFALGAVTGMGGDCLRCVMVDDRASVLAGASTWRVPALVLLPSAVCPARALIPLHAQAAKSRAGHFGLAVYCISLQ